MTLPAGVCIGHSLSPWHCQKRVMSGLVVPSCFCPGGGGSGGDQLDFERGQSRCNQLAAMTQAMEMSPVDDIALATVKDAIAAPSPTDSYLTAAPASHLVPLPCPPPNFHPPRQSYNQPPPLPITPPRHPFIPLIVACLPHPVHSSHRGARNTAIGADRHALTCNTAAAMHAKATNNYNFPMPSFVVPAFPRPQAVVPPPTSL